jgi:hypothetical protein
MRRALASAAVIASLCAFLASIAAAARLPAFSFHYPSQDDDRTDCALPSVLVPAGSGGLKVFIVWSGPATWSDTLSGNYGALASMPSRWAAPGIYTARFTVVDSSGNSSCPVWKTFKSKASPWQPSFP